MKHNFYCQIKCGEVEFSIEEWNKSYKEINGMSISEEEKDKLLNQNLAKHNVLTVFQLWVKLELKIKKMEQIFSEGQCLEE